MQRLRKGAAASRIAGSNPQNGLDAHDVLRQDLSHFDFGEPVIPPSFGNAGEDVKIQNPELFVTYWGLGKKDGERERT